MGRFPDSYFIDAFRHNLQTAAIKETRREKGWKRRLWKYCAGLVLLVLFDTVILQVANFGSLARGQACKDSATEIIQEVSDYILRYFSYFFRKTYFVGTCWTRLIKAILTSTHKICLNQFFCS